MTSDSTSLSDGEEAAFETPGEKPDRRFFTMIPNLIDDWGLSLHSVRLYLRIKRRCGESPDGACWETTRSLADSCRMSTSKVVEAKRELEALGLIEIRKRETRHGHFPGHLIRVVDIWGMNARFFIRNRPPGSEEEQDRYPDRNRTRTALEAGPVLETGIKEEPSLRKNQNQKELGEEYDHIAPTGAPAPSHRALFEIHLSQELQSIAVDLINRLNTELHMKGRKLITDKGSLEETIMSAFPSKTSLEKLERSFKALGDWEEYDKAITRALEKGILNIAGIVDFVAKWKPYEEWLEEQGKMEEFEDIVENLRDIFDPEDVPDAWIFEAAKRGMKKGGDYFYARDLIMRWYDEGEAE